MATRKKSSRGSSEPNPERHALGVDAASKPSNLARLRRIEGQVRGLQKMVEAERYCPDILMQVGSVQQALRGVAKELVRNHLEHCAKRAMRGSDGEAHAAIDELIAVWSKHVG